MWKDIMIANEKSIVESIESFKESLDILLEMIKKKDSHELINFFTDIKKSRDELLSDDKN
jgi:prephenate dehydrogenase